MAAAEPDNFFKQKRTTSEIKDKILPAYFNTWSNLHLKNAGTQSAAALLFVDANAGEGYTPQEQPTAPLLILENIHQRSASSSDADWHLNTYLVNPTEAITEKLKANLEQLPYYPELPDKPDLLNETALLEQIASAEPGNQPALFFLDPARQGLTRQLLLRARHSPATDVLLVCNFNKLQQVLVPAEQNDWENAFWENRLNETKQHIQTEASSKKREGILLAAFEAVFKEAGFYTFKFNIAALGKNPSSQYLLLLTKSLCGYLGIKEIMQAYSEYQEDGIPLFKATNKPQAPLLPGFFRYLSNYTLDNLVEELARNKSQFHYKTLQAIYEEHSVGTNYIKINYLQALQKLQSEGVLYPVDTQNKKVKAITDTSVIFYNLHRSRK